MYPTHAPPQQSHGLWNLHNRYPSAQAQQQRPHQSQSAPVVPNTAAHPRQPAAPAPAAAQHAPHPYYPPPPPAPPGVNPQHWQNGQWRYNGPAPASAPVPAPAPQGPPGAGAGAVAHPTMVGWNIPHGWGIPAQYYYPAQKRPEENYWDTQLSDNGLKLEGMEIRNANEGERTRGVGNAPPHTPWTWVPRELDADPETNANTDANARPQQQQPPIPNGMPPQIPGQPYRPPASMSYFSVPGQNQQQGQQQHVPPPTLPPPAQYSQQPQVQASQRQQLQAHATHPQSFASSQAQQQNSNSIQRAHTLPAPVARQPESFTEVKQLRTTFSPAIIRTPLHYRQGSSTASASASASSSARQNGIYSPALTASANTRSADRAQSHPAPSQPTSNYASNAAGLARQHSAPAPILSREAAGGPGNSIAHLSHFAEEPDDMGILSPLVGALPAVVPEVSSSESSSSSTVTDGSDDTTTGTGPTPSHPRSAHLQAAHLQSAHPQYAYIPSPVTPRRDLGPRSRARTPDTESESSSSESESEAVVRRRREREREQQRERSTYRSSRSMPRPRSRTRSRTPSRSPPGQPQFRPRGASVRPSPIAPGPYTPSPKYPPSPVYTPPTSYRPNYTPPSAGRASRAGPLPAPPTSSYAVATHSSLPPPQQATPPAGTFRARVRYGYWNKRGDFLTPDMYVVYAPQERANPAELAGYPSPTEGYRDHTGAFLRYEANRLELAESLPRHGRPPVLPYERFITYVYI
ncbi:hypothetical protein FA95DRAFT_1684087 [Auriscalpium vulgare]|uniref:Uncharacterized protein n=1 Tax=Auriscalpium vulgare TaxID=40419 RepID=A0ACB8R6X3_9AGAM|nr:hypothetical protein FA95DRAFT_1684087 [Auriscalpium vulgare]